MYVFLETHVTQVKAFIQSGAQCLVTSGSQPSTQCWEQLDPSCPVKRRDIFESGSMTTQQSHHQTTFGRALSPPYCETVGPAVPSCCLIFALCHSDQWALSLTNMLLPDCWVISAPTTIMGNTFQQVCVLTRKTHFYNMLHHVHHSSPSLPIALVLTCMFYLK